MSDDSLKYLNTPCDKAKGVLVKSHMHLKDYIIYLRTLKTHHPDQISYCSKTKDDREINSIAYHQSLTSV